MGRRGRSLALGMGWAVMLTSAALAVPSYSRQTGDSCAACHVSAFGPQLTPHGQAFKLKAYAESTGTWTPPVSAMAVVSYLHTDKDNPASEGDANDNFRLDEASIFIAGKIAGPVGTFAQITYEGPGHVWGIDNVDIRAAFDATLGGMDTVIGFGLNNNPGVQDPWNTFGPWRYPYNDSEFAIGPSAGTLIDGGLGQQVIGGTVYAMIDNRFYVEAGAYGTPSDDFLDSVGVSPDEAAKLDGAAFYGRFAYQRDWSKQNFHAGAALLTASIYPDRDSTLPADDFTDLVIDAGYQWLGDRKNIFTVQGAYTYEWQDLKGSYGLGDVEKRKNDLQSITLDGTYVYDQTYEATVGLSTIWGGRDSYVFVPDPVEGSRTGKPDTTSLSLEGAWTPFGKEASWGAPYVNVKLGMRYTHDFTFNGASNDYDGYGRDASDNDAILGFLWTAF